MVSYQQGLISKRFKEKEKFAKMVTYFSVSKTTISLKTAIVSLINKYPKMKNFSSFLYFLNKHMKVVKEICKENASDFE